MLMFDPELISISVPALKIAALLDVAALSLRSEDVVEDGVDEVENAVLVFRDDDGNVTGVGTEIVFNLARLPLMLISPRALREVLLVDWRVALVRVMLSNEFRIRLFPEVIDPDEVMLFAVMVMLSLA